MIGCIPGGFPNCGKELLSEIVSHHAVDDEVDAGVDDHGEVGKIRDEPDSVWGLEIATNLFTPVNISYQVEQILTSNTW